MEDKTKQKKLFIWVVIVLVVIVGALAALGAGGERDTGPGKYDEFAMCLQEEGATFYGAFWCPHCQDQKKSFGKSSKLLPYVECSTADGQGQTTECQEAGIRSYPTWEFADGSRRNGEMSLEELSLKTGCALPE